MTLSPLFKDTSLVSIITVAELTKAYGDRGDDHLSLSWSWAWSRRRFVLR